jgi:hypothetical protein
MKKIGEIMKYFLTIASFVGIVSAATISNYKAKEDRIKILENQVNQNHRTDSLFKTINVLDNTLNLMSTEVADIKAEQRVQGRKQDNLKALVIQEFAKTMNSQQVLDMINMLEKRNTNNDIEVNTKIEKIK